MGHSGGLFGVLRLQHCGKTEATAAEFLAAVKPEMAVISLGNDNADHPPS